MAGRLDPLLLGAVLCVAGMSFSRIEGVAMAEGLDAKGEETAKEATQLYKQGQYEEAAKLYARLGVDYPDMPIFERNVGACFYYLRKPNPALSNLRNYLNHKKGIALDDKAVVDRWIDEMEKLRAQDTSASTTVWPALAPTAPAPSPWLPPSGTVSAAGGLSGPAPLPPPPPAPSPDVESDESAFRHDGFYLRFSASIGATVDTLSGSDTNGTEMQGTRVMGLCFTPLYAAVGGTIGRTVIGGMLAFAVVPAMSYSGGSEASHSVTEYGYIMMGPFVDFFPDPHGGTHFGAAFGLANATIMSPASGADESSPGGGALLKGGYDFWIGRQWSIGADLSLMFVYGEDEHRVVHSAIVPQVSVSALFH
jgi:hypothetical protein